MNYDKAAKLIVKLIEGKISEEESNILCQWLEIEEHFQYFNDFIEVSYLINTKQKFIPQISKNKVIQFERRRKNKKSIYLWYKIAAVMLILITIGYIYSPKENKVDDFSVVESTVEIGGDKAVLTLDDGSNVVLKKGSNHTSETYSSNGKQLVYSKLAKNTKPLERYNYLTTPKGGQFFVKLSDGTEVWLNSESKIKYPVNFERNQDRVVELIYGEAYFDVTSSELNNGSGFSVYTIDSKINVLGTEFNVKNYRDEQVMETTLLEGKVAVKRRSEELLTNTLKPKEQYVYDRHLNTEVITSVNVDDVVSWKYGFFKFTNQSLGSVMKTLSRWYKVEVVFESPLLKDIELSGSFNKKQNIESILYSIQSTSDFKIDIEENKITFK